MNPSSSHRSQSASVPYEWRQVCLEHNSSVRAYTSNHYHVRVEIREQDNLLAIAGTLHHLLDTENWAEEWEIDFSKVKSPSLGLVSILYGFEQLCKKQNKRLIVAGHAMPLPGC